LKEGKKTYYWLDLMRGVAALAVMAGHIRTLTLTDYHPGNSGVAGKLFYFATGFGHQAVVIFFVLSGFLITMSIHKAVNNGSWSPANYATDRLTRLWIVLLPALLLTLCFDRLGMLLFPDSIAYTGQITTLPDINPAGKLGWATFAGNVFFLQKIRTEVFGTNSPLWSLSYEFWYYCIFPLLFFALFRRYENSVRAFTLLAAAGLLWFIGPEARSYFVVWLMGSAAYFLHLKLNLNRFGPILIAMVVAVFICLLAGTRVGLYPVFINDFSLGIATALLVALTGGQAMTASFLRRTSTFFSNISYTTYLLHMPLAIFFSSWLLRQRNDWGATGLGVYAAVFVIVFLVCYVIWFLFERNTYRAKSWIKLKTKTAT